MKRVLISILLLTFVASTAWAQPAGKGKGQGMRGQGQRMQHIQQTLGLSQEQVQQIQAIRQNGGSRDDIRAVLTDEQRATMDEHRAARQGLGNGGPGNRPRDGSGQGYGSRQPTEPSDSGDG